MAENESWSEFLRRLLGQGKPYSAKETGQRLTIAGQNLLGAGAWSLEQAFQGIHQYIEEPAGMFATMPQRAITKEAPVYLGQKEYEYWKEEQQPKTPVPFLSSWDYAEKFWKAAGKPIAKALGVDVSDWKDFGSIGQFQHAMMGSAEMAEFLPWIVASKIKLGATGLEAMGSMIEKNLAKGMTREAAANNAFTQLTRKGQFPIAPKQAEALLARQAGREEAQAVASWRAMGFTSQDIAELKIMAPKLRELHTHQARLTGFRNVSDEAISDYLNKSLALAKETKDANAIKSIKSAIKYHKTGDLREAVLESEKGLGYIHQSSSELVEHIAEMGRLRPVMKSIEEVLGLPIKYIKGVMPKATEGAAAKFAPKTGQPLTTTIYRGLAKKGEGGIPVTEYGTAPQGYFSTSENVAAAYARGEPKGAIESLSPGAGKIIQKQVSLKNPYVIQEGVEDKYLEGVMSRARKASAKVGKDMAAQEKAAADAVPKALQRKGYDG